MLTCLVSIVRIIIKKGRSDTSKADSVLFQNDEGLK